MNTPPEPVRAGWRPRIAALVLLSSGLAAAAATRDFEWMRPIEGATEPGGIYRLELPPDVPARSHQFPGDLRIVDGDGKQWPFLLQRHPAEPTHQALSARTLNTAWVDTPPHPYLRIDLAIESGPDGARPTHNQLRLLTSGGDFVRRVEIYGSEQQTEWGLLGEGYLIQTHRPRPMTENTIDYPSADYPHLQIRIHPNVRNALERFSVQRAEARMSRPPDRPTATVEPARLTPAKADRQDGAQILLLDLGEPKQPIEALRIRGGQGDYVRRVTVHTRDESDAPWRYAAAGDIHRIGDRVKDRLPLRATGRYLLCAIYHYDDEPLAIDTVQVELLRQSLIVEAQPGPAPALYYGGVYAKAPRYDLEARLDQPRRQTATLLPLGAPTANPAFKPPGYGRFGPLLATLALAATSLAVLFVIVRMFRQTTAHTPPAD